MADDAAALPRLPATKSREKQMSWAKLRCSSPVNSSSDAFFSSDDDHSIDKNDVMPRKQYKGPWFDHPQRDVAAPCLPEMAKGRKRKFERHLDSGVWMGSDTSITDDGTDDLIPTAKRPDWKARPTTVLSLTKKFCSESMAAALIDQYVEEGKEEIDLSSMNLTRLPRAALDNLRLVVRAPPASHEAYSSLKPNFYINLACNNLTCLPKELFEIEHMRLLSLRGNNLAEIPPAIGNLSGLCELNLAQNRLHYLPFEFKQYMFRNARARCLLHPNPYYMPSHREDTLCQQRIMIKLLSSRPPYQGSFHPDGLYCFYDCRSDVRFMDQYGTKVKGPTWPHETTELEASLLIVTTKGDLPETPPVKTSKAPSLVELALSTFVRYAQVQDLETDLLPHMPEHISDILRKGIEASESGGQICTICARPFMIPRTEWIEWWGWARDDSVVGGREVRFCCRECDRDGTEVYLPLMRRGCSWACLPEAFMGDSRNEDNAS